MQTHVQQLVAEMQQENQVYLHSVQELQGLVKDMMRKTDVNDANAMTHLAALDRKVSNHALVNAQELQDIKLSLSAELQDQFTALQGGLSVLQLLPSMQQELVDIQTVLSMLASNTDQKDLKDALGKLQTKIERSDAISMQELQDLRKAMHKEQQTLVSLLESRLSALDLLSPIQEELLQVKSLLAKLKSDVDQSDMAMLQRLLSFEQKLERQGTVSVKELLGLKSLIGSEQQAILSALEAKLSSLDLLSDLQEDVKELKLILQDKERSDRLKELMLSARDVEFPVDKTAELVLGMGGFGQVRLGFYNRRTSVAVKTFHASNKRSAKKDRECVENEVLIMSYINNPKPHPNILLCYGFFEDAAQNLSIVLEYASHGCLANLLDDEHLYPSIPIRLMLSWFDDLASALTFVHEKKVKHKDIKAQNILVFDNYHTKLCDFGMSKKQSMSTTQGAGTLAFMAPEVKQGSRSSYASDVFSMGVTFCQILLGDVPRTVSDDVIDQITADLGMLPLFRQQPHGLQRLRRLLSDCTSDAWLRRPPAGVISYEASRLVMDLGGDLRVQKAIGINVNPTYQVFLDNASVPAKQGQTYPNVWSEATTNEHPSTTHMAVPLSSLTHDEAVQLLIYLGCASDLRQRLGSTVVVNGEGLCEYDDVEFLQELEQDKSKLRSANLKTVLKKLQVIQVDGVSPQVLAMLRAQMSEVLYVEFTLLSIFTYCSFS